MSNETRLTSEEQQRDYIARKIQSWLREWPDDMEVGVAQLYDGDVIPTDVEVADHWWRLDAFTSNDRGTGTYKRD